MFRQTDTAPTGYHITPWPHDDDSKTRENPDLTRVLFVLPGQDQIPVFALQFQHLPLLRHIRPQPRFTFQPVTEILLGL